MRPLWKKTRIFLLGVLLCVGCKETKVDLSGYIEGEYTYIASGVAGTLFNLYVVRGQQVKQGDLLYELDPQPEKANAAAAAANIESLEAQLIYSAKELDRQKRLFTRGATSKDALDQAQSDFDSKTQQLASLKSQLIEAEWSLSQKKIHAPVSGVVFDTFYRVGEKIQENHPALALLAPENIRALFYVPEKHISKIKIGQTIVFSCDGCGEATKAMIQYVSPEAEYTPPVIYSKDTRDKLVYLTRAAMPADIARNFHPGQPIDICLNP